MPIEFLIYRYNDNRFGRSSVGSGNEFGVAVRSLKHFHPTMPIYLFTDAGETIAQEIARENENNHPNFIHLLSFLLII